MDIIDLERLNDGLSTEDLTLLELLKLYLSDLPHNPVMTALWQVAFTSFYRIRTGSSEEHELAVGGLRRALTKP
jgi:hypothetical protein